MLNRGNRLRPDGSAVWPLRQEDVPSLGQGVCASEQRKQLAALERRVNASRETV